MKIYAVYLILILSVACSGVSSNGKVVSSANNVTNVTVSTNKQINENASSPTPTPASLPKDCSAQDEYCLEVVEDLEREAKNINVIIDGKTKWVVKLPSPMNVNGYALNWAKKNKDGFEISIEYGSRNYLNKTFNFIKKDGNFFLNEIKVDSFDKQNTDKSSKKTEKVDPQIALEEFDINKYLN